MNRIDRINQIKQKIDGLLERSGILQAEGRRMIVRKYWHAVLFLGYLVTMTEFALLEKYIVPRFWISCPLDSLIPFVPLFVVPYLLWFPLIATVLILFCFSDRGDFVRTIMLIYTGMTTAMVIYLLFPDGQSLRPIITENDFFSRTVRFMVYANDTNTNCCPSIHVLNQVAVHIGICKSKLFRDRKGWKRASFVLTVLICASTLFIKQHSVVDVVFALILEVPLYLFIYKIDWSRLVPTELKSVISKWELQKN